MYQIQTNLNPFNYKLTRKVVEADAKNNNKNVNNNEPLFKINNLNEN